MALSDALLYGAGGGGTWGKFLLVAAVVVVAVVWYFASLLWTIGVVVVGVALLAFVGYYLGLRVDRRLRYGGSQSKKSKK